MTRGSELVVTHVLVGHRQVGAGMLELLEDARLREGRVRLARGGVNLGVGPARLGEDALFAELAVFVVLGRLVVARHLIVDGVVPANEVSMDA